MTLTTIFLSCFVFGLVFTAGSFFGAGHLHIGHFHLGHGPSPHRGSGWLNGFSIAAFLCWFGGIGYLLQRAHSFTTAVVLLFALSAGCTAAALISTFLTRVLLRHERPLLPEDTEMRGIIARVSNTVRPGRLGEIIFSLNGTRRASAARTLGNRELHRNDEVIVTHYHRGVAWVIPFHTTAETSAEEQHAAPTF
jgi:hypothetical protein